MIPRTPNWEMALFGFNQLALVVLLVRIVRIRLASAYPALTVWLIASIALALVPWLVRMKIQTYYWFYMWAEGSTLVLYLFAVLELYGKVLIDMTGLASAARRWIPVMVAISALGSASLLAFEGHPVRYIDWFYRVDRAVITSLVLFVLMITAFLVWFPIKVSRNTVVYSVGYAAYLVPTGAGLFLMNSGHLAARTISGVSMALGALCLLFWAAALDRGGETSLVSLGCPFRPSEKERLLTQLEAINRMLLRAEEG